MATAREREQAVRLMRALGVGESVISDYRDMGAIPICAGKILAVYSDAITDVHVYDTGVTDKDILGAYDNAMTRGLCAYYITASDGMCGVCVNVLYVSEDDIDNWDWLATCAEDGEVLAYAQNVDIPGYSECGLICVERHNGMIRRSDG